MSLDDPPRLRRSDGISVSMTSGAESACEGNRPSGLGTVAKVDLYARSSEPQRTAVRNAFQYFGGPFFDDNGKI
jgi:hypothetical protein